MPRRIRISGPLGIVAAIGASLVADAPAAAQAQAEWVWPLRGEVITQYRNGVDPYAAGQHRGIDIAGDVGAPVLAAAGGEVRFAGAAGSSGLTVSVRTGDGRFDTSYLHLSSTAVREGQRVGEGERLGAVGTSGVRSTQRPHLHFGVRDAGSRHAYHDPLSFLPRVASPPESPRRTPGPAPVPLMPAPAPEPVRVPAGGRVPASRPAPARPRVPARRRVPARPRAPAARPAPLPRRVPAGRRAPGRHPLPASRPAPLPGRARRAGPAAASRPAAQPAPNAMPAARPGPHALPSRSAPRHADPPAAPGPDAGWVLACVGLLLAAAVLGLSEDGRKATRRGREQVNGLLRPLLGRR